MRGTATGTSSSTTPVTRATTTSAGVNPNVYTYGTGTGLVAIAPTATVRATVTVITAGVTDMAGLRATTARSLGGCDPFKSTGEDRSRLPGPSRAGHARGCDGHPSALAPIDGLQRRWLRPGMNSGRGQGMGRGGLGAGAGGGVGNRGQGRMPQAQSDARMSQSLRTLQGVNMQLSNQGSNTMGHSRARGHVMRAMQELNVALSIR